MIDVEPMPNELCIAHKGRLAWINECGSARETDQLIRTALIERGLNPSSMSKLNQLALVSDLAPTDYARQHSMLPILRVAAKADACHAHGSDDAQTYSVCLGMLTQSQYAYCCVECIVEDLKYRRFSWFRRTHHLTGVDWCPVHGCVLSRVDAESPFSRVPHTWLAAGKLIPVKACQPKLPDAGFLRRYAEIATALLERARPLQTQVTNRRLTEKGRTLGLRPTRVGRRPQISDRLVEAAPEEWLRMHLPGYASKVPLKYFQRIDSLSLRATLGAGEAYTMAMAALYDSAEEAMLDVTRPGIDDEPNSRKSHRVSRDAQYWHGEIWSDYLEVSGRTEDLVDRLDINLEHLRRMLSATGLPNLHTVAYSATWRAFLRFNDGQTLIESCALEKIETIKLENLLRKCNGRVLTAVKTILAKSNGQRGKKPGLRKHRGAQGGVLGRRQTKGVDDERGAPTNDIEHAQMIESL